MPDGSITELCHCHEILALQKSFFDHLLSKLLKFHISEVEVAKSEADFKEEVSVEEETVEDSHFDDVQSYSDNNEDPPVKVKLKRGRKPVIKPESELQCKLCNNRKFCTAQSLTNHTDYFHNPANEFKCHRCEVGSCKTLKNLKAHFR